LVSLVAAVYFIRRIVVLHRSAPPVRSQAPQIAPVSPARVGFTASESTLSS
jgi:hypothetical protein